MPDIETTYSDIEMEMLERVRLQEGLDSVQQAAEWLAKRAIRRGAKRITGRGRALYVTRGGAR